MFSCFTIGLKTALDVCVESLKKLQSKYDKKQVNVTVINQVVDKGPLDKTPMADQTEHMSGYIGHQSDTLDSVSCEFCGQGQHPRSSCPARHARCDFCKIAGHFRPVCRKLLRLSKANPTITTAAFTASLDPTVVPVKICGMTYNALIDTGSTYSFIDTKAADRLINLPKQSQVMKISLASANKSAISSAFLSVPKLELCGTYYENFKLSVLDGLCFDVLLGHDLFSKHKDIQVKFGGTGHSLIIDQFSKYGICNVAKANIEPTPIFHTLRQDAVPVACKSRRYSDEDKMFIRQEVEKLKKEGIVEDSRSPWRAQVLVTKQDEFHKRRMVVDYSKTVNKFTDTDAYPLPRIDDMAIEVSKSKIFSTFDLKSAYHQVPILPKERPFTAFEADGQLLQFTRVPFGVTNGVAHFQRTINSLIKENNLQSTWAYLDNVTVGGFTQAEHDANVQAFYDMVKKYELTLNHDKSIISVKEINMLGYLISHLTLKPDPERMKPLLNLPLPTDSKSLARALGLFAYYSQWIKQFSDKIKPLTQGTAFPMDNSLISAFESLKSDVVSSSLASPNGRDKLVIETDASDIALSARLNQNGRPIAFFSRTLQPHEKRHPAIEKEAAAIVEACRKWRHYLYNSRFRLVTDQRSVSFIFNSADHGKTKNHKIERWRIELSSLSFDITYRPGADNAAADCLSRVVLASVCATDNALKNLHDGLVHPGASRLYSFVRARNLPYSMEDVKRVISKCQICARVKPLFYRPENPPLIKATQALERLAIDFKGPLPSVSQNKYLLTVVDEYSRYPWAFPCKEMTAKTIIDCLDEIFCWCGHAGYIHSDNGPALISNELHAHLLRQRIGHSFSSVYNPRGNGQIERMNGTIWKGVQLCLASDGLEPKHWEKTLRSVLHSIRSLVCTTTNQTPHERIFRFERRTLTGHALPSWLLNKERALVRKQVRKSKYDDWVEECDILHVTPTYAQIRTDSGKEQTVSLRDLAPLPSQTYECPSENLVDAQKVSEVLLPDRVIPPSNDQHLPSHATQAPVKALENSQQIAPADSAPPPSSSLSYHPAQHSENVLRRSSRVRYQIDPLNYDKLGGTNAICDLMTLFVS